MTSSALAPAPTLTAADFARVVSLAHEWAGLAIPAGKEGLVHSRLARRLRETGHATFTAYLDWLQTAAGRDERTAVVDLLTTNKTDFFREPAHFDYLVQHVLPAVVARGTPLRLWSAGCSSGEEPYTLAMVLREELPAGYDVRILATDISTRIVERARQGRYTADQMAGVSEARRKRWFTQQPSPTGVQFTVSRELREWIRFAHLNLMGEWPMKGPFDAILCRNVMIYFDKPTQARLVQRYWELLAPGGHLFVGHSESLTSLEHRYRYVQPAVYAR
ncbi:MAG: protein-glutamate O-methyltransferase [Gemmatimonadaceae bacterium]|nr:protein-glutamate O-methyltransferase [Gemmatimonadaceae bacterium]